MKTTLKLLMAVLLVGWCNIGNAQIYEWQMSPTPNEEYVGMVTSEEYAGGRFYTTDGGLFSENGQTSINHQFTKTDEELYEILLKKARAIYGSQYSYYTISLRNFKASISEKRYDMPDAHQYRYDRYYKISAAVVVPANTKSTNSTSDMEDEDDLTRALDKALQDIREGSRIAIDQVKVPSGTNKDEYKDEVVEILLDKGYKVVAKEYLEKLYEEQQAQQSGIYNDRTTVKNDNFSAVGYYLNVRLTDTSLRVQIINVSTGEYDANVTIKF